MKKKSKIHNVKRRKKLEDEDIEDGLKQSKLSFKKEPKTDEENSDKEEKSDSNSVEKKVLLDKKDLKNGSKQKKIKTKEKGTKKRGRPKSVEKGSKSKKKEKKIKIKKGVDYMKGKYNIKVELIEDDDNLNGSDNKVNNSCCVVCSNRNCVRAAKTQNYKLMKNCINDREHISTFINPYSVSIGNAIEIAIENKDKKLIEMIFNSWNEDANPKNEFKPRCHIDDPKIKLVETGENSVYMVGVRTRKLNQTRGNKMGNDAFIRDDVKIEQNEIANIICETITEKCDDPSFIDFMKSLQFSNNNSDNNNRTGNRYYNFSNNLHFSFDSFIINAVLKGNIEIAKYLLKDKEQNYNFGFNALHYQVLGEENANNLTVKVKTSLTKKPQTNYGMTPMHVVCINPDVSFIKKMIELGADWNVLDDLNRKPIHYAACCKEAGPLNYLISLGALVDEVDKQKKSPLIYACMNGNLECVKSLLRKKANILLKDKLLKNTAFHYACKYGYKDIVEYFLENTDIKIDLPGEERMTGLMLASLYGHYELVEFLINNKAKVTKRDKFKRTCLLHAVRGGQLKIASFLLTKGAEYEFPDSSNNTPLHYACALGFQDIAELLLEAGASPNPSNDWKYTPLEIGFVKNHMGIVKFLLDFVDVNTKFNLDMCLIHYSFKKITKKIIEEEMTYLIIDKECNINSQDYYGESCLHYLANFTFDKFSQDNSEYLNELNRYNKNLTYKEIEEKNKEIYKELIKKIFSLFVQRKTLDINLVNKNGKTAFQIAIEKNNFYFIEEILKLNPQLCFIDQKGNSIFHCIVPFIFENKISIEKKLYVIKEILERLKDNLSDDELNRISNSYDENGFTPLLKLMYEYYKNINRVFEDIKTEESYEYKKQKVIQQDIEMKDTKKGEDNEEEEGEGEEEIEDHIDPLDDQNNNNKMLDSKIASFPLSQDDINQIHIKSLQKLNLFIEFLLSIIKSFISLKMNPMIKVGKIASYRKSPTNINERKNINDKNAKKLSKNKRIELQYFSGQGKNSILLYLMRYPSKILLDYFIKELKIPVNIYNLYKRNCLYFLFDSINQIYSKEKNNSLVIQTLNFLIKEGINVEQIDYKGNNPFLYLAVNNFNVEILTILARNNCDINKFNKDDQNSLFFYVRQKNLNIVKILIEDFKVNYTICDRKKRTIMHYLCNDEISSTDMDERLCDYLLSKRIKLNEPDILGRTPIHYLFVKLNDEYNTNNIDPVNTLTKLLEYDEVDPEYKDIYGNTPLHYACQRGSVISLISLGAKKIDYDVKNKENNSPLAYSLLFKKENVAISLIQQNVNLDQYAYPLKDRNEKKIIKQLEKNKNNSLISVLTNKLDEQINRKSGVDLDVSFIDLESEEESVFSFANNNSKKNEKIKSGNTKKNVAKINENIEEEEENEEYLFEKQNEEINNNEKEDKEKTEEEDNDDYIDEEDDNSEDSSYKSGNNNNNNMVNILPKRPNFPGIMLIKNINSFNNRNFNNYNRNNNINNVDHSICPNYISNLFQNNKNKVKLFRVCIKNNFQGLTHLFITKGYGLMKAVEDSFYEQKFNLAMKLLIRSPNKKTYQALNSDGQNLFHILGHIGNISPVEELPHFLNILYSKEIPLDAKDNFGNTPLHYAAKNLFKEFIKFIINKFSVKKLILDSKNNDNETPLLLSMKGNNINSINKEIFDLLFTNKDINHLYEEDEKIINKLNPQENYKCTLLIFLVRMILKHGLFKEKQSEKNCLKYFYNQLIQNGASFTQKDSLGRTCLTYAVLENDFPFLKSLCEDAGNKIDKNSVDNNGKSLVHYCVSLNNFGSYENKDMLNYLLDNKFLSTSKDNFNKTPLDYALEQKTLNNLKILKNKKVPGTEKLKINENEYKNNQDELDEEKVNSIPKVNFEKDGEEYYNKKLSSVDPSKGVKKPNLEDYQTEFYELYKENDEYWDASLTKVNLQNGIYGEYMFYFIQLIHDLGKDMYIVTTQFGRIGEEGANQRSPFNSLDEAKNEFEKVFKSKTGNLWEERNNFERKKGKYMLLTYNKIRLKPNELLKPFDYEKCPKSKIDNKDIHSLLKAFTDSSIIAKVFKDSGVDTKFFNYSMLNKEILIKARNYLLSLYKKVQELEDMRNIKIKKEQINNKDDKKIKKNKEKNNDNDDDDNNSEENMDIDEDENNSKSKKKKDNNNNDNKNKEFLTQKDKIDAIISKTNEIMELSSRYYELIPKEKFRNSCILPFDTLEEVKKEILIIDNLTYVEKAVNILLGANNKIQTINPLDYIYYSLQTYFETLKEDSSEYETLKKYINNTSSDKIVNIFRVTRKGESERIEAYKDLPNHYLLFHGTKIFNLIGIFSNGLKIAPPEAPVTGYLFGKGIYLADMYQKSIDYCDTFIDKSNPKNTKKYSYILLCEAALGKIYEAKKENLDVENLPFLKNGFNSLKSVSDSGPDLTKNFICNNGIIIPLGNIIEYKSKNNNSYLFRTGLPEYVVYDTSQIKIRYIIHIERNSV